MECVWPVEAMLGEGPMWHPSSQSLWFVDIKGGRINRYRPADGARETIEVGGQPSFIVPADDGGFVVGDRAMLHRFDGRAITGRHAEVAMPAGNRFNDATVDGRGRLWFGSMDDGEAAPSGRVFLHDGGEIAEAGAASVITNGPAVTSDGRFLYHVDTAERTIWRFDVADTDRLENGRPFARIEDGAGFPDGVTLDAEGHLWVGLWQGWGLRRYAPDGTLVRSVPLPCANVTKLAFGGPDLATAFVTTARIGIEPAALADQPLAGGLFAFAADVPGVALPAMRLGTAA